MKKLVVLAIALLVCFVSEAEQYPEMPSWTIVKTELDESLTEEESLFEIHFWTEQKYYNNHLIYSDNGNEEKVKLKGQTFIQHKCKPGKHLFMFLIDIEMEEIITDSIAIQPGHKTTIQLNFSSSVRPQLVKKPVIYLYPEVETAVTVSVHPTGDLIFTYPNYQDQWQVNAKPDGTLETGGNYYNYLFWEAEQYAVNELVDPTLGNYVSGNQITAFLELTLTEYGLTSKEQADFITYWAPMMKNHKNLYIYFVIDEACDQFATLTIDPKPDNIGRIYMLWRPVSEAESERLIPIQTIKPIDRTGFTVIEWGGVQLSSVSMDKEL